MWSNCLETFTLVHCHVCVLCEVSLNIVSGPLPCLCAMWSHRLETFTLVHCHVCVLCEVTVLKHSLWSTALSVCYVKYLETFFLNHCHVFIINIVVIMDGTFQSFEWDPSQKTNLLIQQSGLKKGVILGPRFIAMVTWCKQFQKKVVLKQGWS